MKWSNPLLQSVSGERNVAAIYYQIDIPIIRNLTFSQSGRYDHYSDFGGAFSPRYALRYQPVSALTMYGSFNRGFRAPTFVENTASTNVGLQQNGNNLVRIHVVTKATRICSLSARKNYNLGFELSPTRTTDVGFDWYKIRVTNVIGQANLPTVIDQNNPSQVVRNPDGSIAYVNLPYENLGYLDTDGFEGTLRQSLKTTVGTFTLSADWAYVNHFKIGLPGQSPLNSAGNNLAIDPAVRWQLPALEGQYRAELGVQQVDDVVDVAIHGSVLPGDRWRRLAKRGVVQSVQPVCNLYGYQALDHLRRYQQYLQQGASV